MTFQAQYDVYRTMVETYLERLYTDTEKRPYGRLQEAMRYSLMAGGKRVRPVLTLAFCALYGGAVETALPLACALEMVHTYSLIHDDLPCMDDDALRRGKPSCHIAYGEATAVLAGDALQADAFGLIAGSEHLSGEQRAEAIRILASACGGDGMVAGQILDLAGPWETQADLERLYGLKCGALFRAAAGMGCVAAGADRIAREKADAYAAHLGLAFQARDDMLDAGADTRYALLATEETGRAKVSLEDNPASDFLRALADSLGNRRN